MVVIRYIYGNEMSADQETLETLAEFRFELRQFLQFSERSAEQAGLQPQQHQMLLQVAGAPGETQVTISYVAQRLGLRHHTAVELSKRCEAAGLVRRVADLSDRRQVLLHLTKDGQKILRRLSEVHALELHALAPRMIQALNRIRNGKKLIANSEATAK
jgi:DNA-binding MarR family transcriptional regulator